MILKYKTKLVICPSPEYPTPIFPMSFVFGILKQVAVKVKGLPEDLPIERNKIFTSYASYWYNKFDEHTYFFYAWPQRVTYIPGLHNKTIYTDRYKNKYRLVLEEDPNIRVYFALTDPTMYHLQESLYELPYLTLPTVIRYINEREGDHL